MNVAELQAREVPVRLAANVHHLLVVIGGIERSMSKFDTTKHKYITDVVGLDQLLKAAHLLVWYVSYAI